MLTRKSSKSIMVEPAPNGCIPDSTLNPKAQGRERININNPLIIQDFFRLHPSISDVQEIMFSNVARTVERAAKDINTKNKLPQTIPPGRLLKRLGRDMKIRLGPLST